MKAKLLLVLLVLAAALSGCTVSHPIVKVDSNDSALKNAVYKGEIRMIVDATELEKYPSSEQYRVYELNAAFAGFEGIPEARDFATNRMVKFCRDMNKDSKALFEQTSVPPYILGNYPFVEITFICIDKTNAPIKVNGDDDRYVKILQLKSLLDNNAITQDEYNKEKFKLLNE